MTVLLARTVIPDAAQRRSGIVCRMERLERMEIPGLRFAAPGMTWGLKWPA
jgi:hypothetical protein